jgi:beta-galactosidase
LSKNFYRSLLLIIFFLQLLSLSSSILAQSRAEVKLKNNLPTLFIDGKVYPPFAYMSYLGEKKYYKEIAAAGIHLYNIPAYFAERGINSVSGICPFRPPIWIGKNQYDFSSLIKDFNDIIESDPQAKVIIRFYLDPPLWWEKANPDASCQLADGSTFRQCFASQKWRIETGKVLEHCIDWLLTSQYAKHLTGIHVASGFTEEWFYHPKQYSDENPVRLETFRKWLKRKYNNIKTLQKVWNNPNVTFNSAQLANISEKSRNEWRNPINEQNYVDTYRFNAEIMADNIAYFCKIVKEKSDGALLTGAFYGYHYFVTDPRRGHGALGKLLNCRYLDYLSSPNNYNRVIGEDWPPMAAVQSVQLHGKLWLAENDTRTSITTLLKDRSIGIAPPGQYESGVWLGPEDMQTSVAFLWKNSGRMLAYGYGGWWFDMWGGWFSDPALLNVLKKTQQFYMDFSPQKTIKMSPQVCVIVDEELSFWDASYGKLTNNILCNCFPLAKTGTSYDLFLRSDLENISASQYKVIWLMGFLSLKDSDNLRIKKWRKEGITVLWTDGYGTKIYYTDNKEDSFEKKIRWRDSELRDIWKKAGVHLYIKNDDVFYAGNNWLCIHTVKGGKRTIKLPFYAQVIEADSHNIIADSISSFDVKLKPKSTIILRINPN